VAEALIRAAIQPPAPGHDLTSRERQVLELMVKGLSNNEIGERLVVSQSTIKTHVSSILSKLGVASRTEAVALAVQYNLLTDRVPRCDQISPTDRAQDAPVD